MRNEGFPLYVTGVGFSMLKLVYVVFATLYILRKLVFGRRLHLLPLHQGSHRPGKVLEFDLGPGKLLVI